MDLTLTIPDALAPRVIDALAAAGGWEDVATDGPKAAFARQHLKSVLRQIVIRHELLAVRQAAASVEQAAIEQARADRAAAVEAVQTALETEVDLG